METAGKTLDEKELAEAMKENGLGTPATRADILENLLSRAYLERDGKVLVATERGIRLIALVHPSVKSPALTGRWEAELARIQRGEGQLDAFMIGIENYVREIVGETMRGAPNVPLRNGSAPTRPQAEAIVLARPPRQAVAASQLGPLLKRVFGHDAFRPFQEAVCRAVTEGRDALLVMPTGAGKSLCYQLPGLARAGTTLVISPLIALIEDQVAQLRALGLVAERIHSGIDRLASKQVCRDYLDGKLDFLFIAPERLSVRGFPEMLAKRTPALVAVDEAHCISHWGHDFRPDYRLLGGRLPLLRPAPVIALTATATPRVQDDITQLLGLTGGGRFIHGFRRTNIAVEVAEAPPSRRAELVSDVLADPARRPAIVYTPSRREATSLAEELQSKLKAVAYHAGMTAGRREDAQRRFLEGRAEVIVATIAFGMGIDKANVRTVIHTGLPASVEGYYQEIGRAGRDGLPSRAILLHSYGDTRTHEFFLARDYPETHVLEKVFRVLKPEPIASDDLRNATSLVPELFEKALEKLWSFGGAIVTPDGEASRGIESWKRPYEEQREHRKTQLDLMRRFAEGSSCRMLQLVRHFGDQEDSGARCGLCDSCVPSGGVATKLREPSAMEEAALRRALELLRMRDGQATGQLHREVVKQFPAMERRNFEELLGSLARGGLVRIDDDQFEKDGQTIRFRRAYLTGTGRRPDAVIDARIPVAPLSISKRKRGKKVLPKLAKGSKASSLAKPVSTALVEMLRRWRLEEARRQRVPAFRILTDLTLLDVAAKKPRNGAELLEVGGIGPSRLEKYGARILGIVKDSL
jgi:DNA topoisomerase-3